MSAPRRYQLLDAAPPLLLASLLAVCAIQMQPACVQPPTLSDLDDEAAVQQVADSSGATGGEQVRELTPAELEQLLQNGDARQSNIVFVIPDRVPEDVLLPGEIRMWAGRPQAVPPNWVLCNGAEYDIDEFPRLYDAIGNSFGGDAGAGTFRVPDFRNRSPMGANSNSPTGVPLSDVSGSPLAFGGAPTHTLSVSEMPNHRHRHIHTHPLPGDDTITTGNTVANLGGPLTPGGMTIQSSFPDDPFTDFVGGGQPHNNLHPYFAVHYLIYTGLEGPFEPPPSSSSGP